MKIVLLSPYTKLSQSSIPEDHPTLPKATYSEAKSIIDSYNYWQIGWNDALQKKGFEILTLPVVNGEILCSKWAMEAGLPTDDYEDILIHQMKEFKPEILIYNHYLSRFLSRIKKEVQSIKKVVLILGSANIDTELYRQVDLSITCSTDFIKMNADLGVTSYRIHHAFNPVLLKRLESSNLQPGNSGIQPNHSFEGKFIFIGSIQRRKYFHYEREAILKALIKSTDIEIYSPSYYYTTRDNFKTIGKQLAFLGLQAIGWIPGVRSGIAKVRYLEKILTLQDFPVFPVSSELKPFLKPPLFGNPMFRALKEASINLNTHGDGQNTACNMRLFEVTGVGSCLLTDWKPDLKNLFEIDTEIVAYKTPAEAAEKAKYLLENPNEASKIALAGQKKTLNFHTFDARADELIDLMKKKNLL